VPGLDALLGLLHDGLVPPGDELFVGRGVDLRDAVLLQGLDQLVADDAQAREHLLGLGALGLLVERVVEVVDHAHDAGGQGAQPLLLRDDLILERTALVVLEVGHRRAASEHPRARTARSAPGSPPVLVGSRPPVKVLRHGFAPVNLLPLRPCPAPWSGFFHFHS
jgi:hypothetical protein